MTISCELPAFSIGQATLVARDLFGIEGTLECLNGERDLNFRLSTNSSRYVLKIANQNEAYGMLECQHQVFERLAVAKVMQQQALSIKSLNNKVIETVISDIGISHYCRVMHYIEARLLCELSVYTPKLLRDIGNTLAKLDHALQDFNHESLHRPLIWNMCKALDTLKSFKPMLASAAKRALVDHFESRFRNTVLPLQGELSKGVIHNDANDNNILVSGDITGPQRVCSIIDFGDMVYSWLAVEPAVAAAYAMFNQDKPVEIAAAIVQGYHQYLPLQEADIAVLFELICMRLCMSVCICAHQQSIQPGNQYLSISEQPAWNLLYQLESISQETVHNMFRDACGLPAATN